MDSRLKHFWLQALLSVFLSALLPLSAGAAQKATTGDLTWEKYRQAGYDAITQGNLDAAEDLFRQALNAVQRVPHKPIDVVKCQNSLARAFTLQARAEEAESMFKRSLDILRRAYGAKSPELVQTMLDLGSIYESEGDHPAAMALYNQVLSINQSNFGPEHPETAHSLHRLARAKSNAGKQTEAESDYKHAINILEKHPDDGEMKTLLKDYADLLRKTNRLAEADEIERKVRPAAVQQNITPAVSGDATQSSWQQHLSATAGSDQAAQNNTESAVLSRAQEAPFSDPKLRPVYSTLADVQYRQGRFTEAEPLYKNILSIDEKTLGANHPGVAADLTNLALLYMAQRRYSEAEPLVKRALSIYEGSYGSGNLLVIKTRSMLASIYEMQSNLPQAETYYKEALEKAQSGLGPNDAETARVLNSLAFLYYKEGKLAESETTYKWALASTEAAFGQQDSAVAACLKDYALVLRKLNRNDEADKLEARAKNILASVR